MAGSRIDQTRGHFTGEDLIEAGWLQPIQVLISSARPLGFGKELAVGQKQARH